MKRRERIVILGNGVAGNTAMEAIRSNDRSSEVAIVSEEPYPEYSACALPYYVSGQLPRKRLFLKSLGDYREVRARLGECAREIDLRRCRVFLERGSISYDKLIVATGGEPVIPSIGGAENGGVYVLKTLRDADRLARLRPTEVAIIGSGLIGVEAAAAMKKRGHRVSLISRRWVLPRILDEEAGRRVERILERNGVQVFTGDAVKEIVRVRGRVSAVRTEKRLIPCDVVVMAAGIKPRVSLAEQAGMEIGPLGGIRVNERMETGHPGVYSCGDCAEAIDPATGETALPLRWFNARQMGRIAGLHCAGSGGPYRGILAGVVLDLFGTAAGSIGRLSLELKEKKVEVIETDHGASYARVLVSDYAVKGAQFIGRTEEAGILFSLIQNRSDSRGLTGRGAMFPWYRRLDQYLEAG